MSKLRVKEIAHSNGTVAATIDTTGKVTPDGGVAGSIGGGMVRLGSVEWSTDTWYHDFDVIDSTKYMNYFLYWTICHENTADSGNKWQITSLRFKDSGGAISSGYDNNCMWVHSGQTAEQLNNTTYAGAKNQIWMAGNGENYDSMGFAQITVPNASFLRAGVRGSSQLIGAPRTQTTAGANYKEDFASVHMTQNPTAITGIRIMSWYGDGYTSKFGSVQIYGLEK